MSHLATLWLAPGMLLRNDIVVPSPPPRSWIVAILEPMRWIAETAEPKPVRIQRAEFLLTDYSRTGGVAHYELRTGPPDGWRWLAVNGRLQLERVSGHRAPHYHFR